jgi:hypothetical protein
LQRFLEDPVEGLVEEAVVEVVAVLLLLVVPVGLVVRAVRAADPLDQMDHRLSLMGSVVAQVPALAFWGDLAWAGFLG